MLKILSASQLRSADAATLKSANISSFELMERAVQAIFSSFRKEKHELFNRKTLVFFCGMGNNGGDGLALARLFLNQGKTVRIFIIKHKTKGSPDFERNLEIVREICDSIIYLDQEKYSFLLNEEDVVIDSIFGIGLTRPIDGFIKLVIQELNQLKNPVISIDSPSGLFAEDNSSNDPQAIVQAVHTFTIGAAKLSFFLPSNHHFTGNWNLVPIGLDEDFISQTDRGYFILEEKDIQAHLQRRATFTHKGDYGHAIIVAGSYGKIGAALLSTKACLKMGAGLVTAIVPKCGYEILQLGAPEAMVMTSEGIDHIEMFELSAEYNAIAVGPGIGVLSKTAEMLFMLLQQSSNPIVIDADALNILSKNKKYLSEIPVNSILTPHPGEFKRLVGEWKNDYERLQLLKKFAIKHKVFVILKGKYSSLATPSGEIYFNSTGNPGMATGGSGDVLTGILCSLLAQGYEPFYACIIGMYIHGMAGDLAADAKTEHAMLAGDIIEAIPKAYMTLSQSIN